MNRREERRRRPLRCGCAGADAKRGKTTRPFQSLPKSGWAGAGDRLEGGRGGQAPWSPPSTSPGLALSHLVGLPT